MARLKRHWLALAVKIVTTAKLANVEASDDGMDGGTKTHGDGVDHKDPDLSSGGVIVRALDDEVRL